MISKPPSWFDDDDDQMWFYWTACPHEMMSVCLSVSCLSLCCRQQKCFCDIYERQLAIYQIRSVNSSSSRGRKKGIKVSTTPFRCVFRGFLEERWNCPISSSSFSTLTDFSDKWWVRFTRFTSKCTSALIYSSDSSYILFSPLCMLNAILIPLFFLLLI